MVLTMWGGDEMRVLVLGALRPGGFNEALAATVVQEAPDALELVSFEGLERLPLYTRELDDDGVDAGVDRLRREVRAADAVVVVTPEHNALPSAAVKNAVDIASRPPGAAPLAGKPVAVMSASPGRGGGRRAIAALVTSLGAARAVPVDATVSVPAAHDRRDDADGYDAAVRADVRAALAALAGAGVTRRGLNDDRTRLSRRRAAAPGSA